MTTEPRADRAALERVAADFAGEPDVALGTMFRSPGLRVGQRVFAFLGHDDRLIVKLPRSRAVELVAAGTAEEVTMGTRTMREWVAVPLGDPADGSGLSLWRGLAREAYEYVRGL